MINNNLKYHLLKLNGFNYFSTTKNSYINHIDSINEGVIIFFNFRKTAIEKISFTHFCINNRIKGIKIIR